MKVNLIRCGPSANESEERCFNRLEHELKSSGGQGEWVLLANVSFSSSNDRQSDEIDLIAIGPPGVTVIEVKHWSSDWVQRNGMVADQESDKLTNKSRRIATTLRRVYPDLPFVRQAFAVTREKADVEDLVGQTQKGNPYYTLADWRGLLNLDGPLRLTDTQVEVLATALEPRSAVAIDGSLRRFAGFINLELQSPKEDRFHRVYKGLKTVSNDRGVLHLYDLTASDADNSETIARREYDSLVRLSRKDWTPQVLDSYQPAPGYDGDMYFFSIVNPEAPSIRKRAQDQSWSSEHRIAFCRDAVSAVSELHQLGLGSPGDSGPALHRNITTETVLVKYDNAPILTGMQFARISDTSILITGPKDASTPPEIVEGGIGVATAKSDVFSLSHSLSILFQDRDDDLSKHALSLLQTGLIQEPDERTELAPLKESLSSLLREMPPAPAQDVPSHIYWSEEQTIPFQNRKYKIISSLGKGGIGRTWKVELLDLQTGEPTGGLYVAKVASNEETGQRVLKSYALGEPYIRHELLSTIHRTADVWADNTFAALMSWIDGDPFDHASGLIHHLGEELVLRWLRGICGALDSMHDKNLVHGDVSPKNLIVSPSLDKLELTDYDFVCRIGDPVVGIGTYDYSPQTSEGSGIASASDDIYSLAASFFSVLFERRPFIHDGEVRKERGLNWDGLDKDLYPTVVRFLSRATDPERINRYANCSDALVDLLDEPTRVEEPVGPKKPEEPVVPVEQTVERLRSILESYPGSRLGNKETRGLDTDFAHDTFVVTQLEKDLLKDIQEKRRQLIILCGNAGDGKTALLQHIAGEIGLGVSKSSQRILNGTASRGGAEVWMNLDGSASWDSKSANDILDDFLAPFSNGPSNDDIVHLLAINDGRLLEWVDHIEEDDGFGRSNLTDSLQNLLLGESERQSNDTSHIRLINLNDRSLVGKISFDIDENADSDVNQTDDAQGRTGGGKIDSWFLDALINQLYGGARTQEIWSDCTYCSAKEHCKVYQTAGRFAPDGHPAMADQEVREVAREKLYRAFRAVHLTGDTHISMRELRSALVYILFGMYFCSDYHSGEQKSFSDYWDRAFDANSEFRQGELLSSLSRFDPGLEASPRIDRKIESAYSKDEDELDSFEIRSARRRAYFEWSDQRVNEAGMGRDTLDIARGRHLQDFEAVGRETDNSRICEELCRGISRLEDLPELALNRSEIVPLRITPRTSTETYFWVEKSLSSFELITDLSENYESADMVDRLHRQVILVYHYKNGEKEFLHLGAELFYLLLEISRGYQLGDISTDGNFAHMSIFVRRLLRETQQELFAWNPIQEETVYHVSSQIRETGESISQPLVLSPLDKRGHYA